MTPTKTITLKTAGYNHPEIGSMRKDVDKLCAQAKMNSIWTNNNNCSSNSAYNTSSLVKSTETLTKLTMGVTLLQGLASVFSTITPMFKRSNTTNNGDNDNNNKNNSVNINTQSGVEGLNAAVTNYDQNGDVKGLETQIKAQEKQYEANVKLIANMGKQEETANTNAQQKLTEANTANDVQKKAYDDADGVVTQADEAVGAAKIDVINAESAYNTAKLAYENAVATNPKANNTTLKTAMDNAEKAKQKAIEKEKDAESKRDKAKEVRAKEKTKLDATIKTLETATTTAGATAKALAEVPKAKQDAEIKNAQLKLAIEQAKAKLPSYKGGEIKKEEKKTDEKNPKLIDSPIEETKNNDLYTA